MVKTMHEKTYPLVNDAIKKGVTRGPDKNCDYFPCHEILEDCTFCYCPFYSCNDETTGGKEVISSKTGKPVWSCADCVFPHTEENSKAILEKLLAEKKKLEDIPRKTLLRFRKEILKSGGKK